MIINKIAIRNLKSFGNDFQEITLNNEGNLILLSGKNGSGKSTIIDAFDYGFFNKVSGRTKKYTKLSSLPNRINGDSEVIIDFIAQDGTAVKIRRGYKPSKLQLWQDTVEETKAGDAKKDAIIVNHVGVDYETFKGFISMSINDFKNFISLSNEEKKLLLDKMFNLEVIEVLNKILNDLIRDNKKESDLLDREISIISENISNVNSSIERVKASKQDDLKFRIEEITFEMNKYREPFNMVKEKLEAIKEKKAQISTKMNSERTKLIELNSEIKQIDKQLELFDNDKCPVCQADLDSGFHQGLKESYLEKKNKFIELRDEVKTEGLALKEKEDKLTELYDKGQNKYNEINTNLKSLKRELDGLNEKQKNDNMSVDLKEFYDSVTNLNIRLNETKDKKSITYDKSIYHKHIKGVLSENGVKKSIIKNIIEPINLYVQENIQKMHLPFEVVLDDSFSASITSFGEEVDIDTLSVGETKKINVAILIAYLRLIRTKKQLNVLFLDEVFSSVDVESINDVIRLLRDLADHSKINIFLIHHSILDSYNFDKIYEVKKDVFSYIQEVTVD